MAGPSCDTITTIYTLPDLLLSCQRRAGELMLASRTSTVRKPTPYDDQTNTSPCLWSVVTTRFLNRFWGASHAPRDADADGSGSRAGECHMGNSGQ
jgi:hypothetical protein